MRGPTASSFRPAQWLGRAFAALLLRRVRAVLRRPARLASARADQDRPAASPRSIRSRSATSPTLVENWQHADRLPEAACSGPGSPIRRSTAWPRWSSRSSASIPAGYALALTEFRGRRPLLALTLVVMLVPSTALVLPIFLELSAVKLIGIPLAVILPFSFFPFGVYLTYIYFSTAISTRSSRRRPHRRRRRAPGLQPGSRCRSRRRSIALVGFFSFTSNWNNYFLPYVTVPGRKAPIQVGIAELLSNVGSSTRPMRRRPRSRCRPSRWRR